MKSNRFAQLDHRHGLVAATALTGALMLAAAPAKAQPSAVQSQGAQSGAQSDGQQAPTVDEFVVTARKRAESVQTVPDSIRPISSQELERLGADSLSDYAGVTPGLQLTGARAATQVVVRGVTTGPVNHDQTEIKETVGLYLDETPIAVQRYNPNLKLFDLDHIEVLRGPQGTLYGAGSMAGAIRMITRKPQADHYEAEAEASTGHVTDGGENYSLDGMVNVPLIRDVLAVRAVGSYRYDAGYIDNTSLNIPNSNSDESWAGRFAARFTPNERFTLDAMVYGQKTDYRAESTYVAEDGVLKSNVVQLEPQYDRILIGSLAGVYNFSGADLTVIGSYLRKKYEYLEEVGGFTHLITGFNDNLGGMADSHSNQKNWSLEARLSSKPDAHINWIGGVFFEHTDNAYGQDVTVPGVDALSGLDSTVFGANPDQLFFSAIDVRQKQLAFFGELNLPLSEKLKLTLGGRQFFAWQEADIDFEGIFAYPNLGLVSFEHKEHGFNPKVNLSYQLDGDHLLYAQAAKGFRLGGTNEPVPSTICAADLAARGLNSAPTSFSADSLWNYEVGAKTSWFDRRLTVNGSIYRIDWKNPQVTAQLPCGFNVYVNAGGLRIYGGELETTIRPMEGLTITAGGAYTDSELTEDLTFVSGLQGDHSPFTPKWTFNASLDYTRPVSDALTGFIYLNYQYTGARMTRFNPAASGFYELPAYGVVNARIGVNADRWSVELFGENLTNELGELNRLYTPYASIPATLVTVINPRTVGVKLRVRY